VSNIVPEKEDLSMDTYNEILVEFYERFVRSTVAKLGLTAELTGPIIDLQRELDSATHDALAVFSIAANKATGSGHPSDRRRWLDFLVGLSRASTQTRRLQNAGDVTSRCVEPGRVHTRLRAESEPRTVDR
jgi:hypothetical protein